MDVAISTLTPLRFLQRSEDVWADRPAVRDGDRLWTYSAHGERVRRAAGALHDALGIADGDRVATLLPNVAAALELHYAVPGAGGVLVPLNTRLAADDYAYILGHAEPRVIVAHPTRREVLEQALARMEGDAPQVIWDDGEYDAMLAAAEPAELRHPDDERALISINYTSGTTGRPKGVVYTHRGAYLNALGRSSLRGGPDPQLGLPLDAPDVPLQRLVHGVGGDCHRRPPRLPARGAPATASGSCWSRRRRDAPQRRSHRAHDDGRRGRRRTRRSERCW